MSLRHNVLQVSADYQVLASDGCMEIITNGILVDLPAYDNIDTKSVKTFWFIAAEAFRLRTIDSTTLAINGTSTYNVPIGQHFCVTLMTTDLSSGTGQWHMTVYDVTSGGGGGGITDLTGDVTATGPGSVPATIANDAVTFAKMQNISTDRLIGRDAAGTGDPAEIALNATLEFDGSNNIRRAALTGDVTASAGSNSTTIANNAVTTAKMVQLGAYKFWGNNTNASANAAEHDFRDAVETAITATITFTGTTAPSGASTLSQWFVRIGNTVFYKFMLTYATTGTAITQVTIAFPTEFPTPLVPTGLNSASAYLYFMDYSRMITTPSGTVTSNANAALRRNAGNTANEFVFVVASNNPRTIHMGGSYRCA